MRSRPHPKSNRDLSLRAEMCIQQDLKVSSRFKHDITVDSAKSHFVDTLRNLNSIYGIIKKKYLETTHDER